MNVHVQVHENFDITLNELGLYILRYDQVPAV